MKKLIFLILTTLLFSQEVYFTPNEGEKAEKRLINLFKNAKHSIKIIIYTFTNKRLAKALKIASSHNVNIDIISDQKEAEYKKSLIYNLAAIKNINVRLLHGIPYKNKKFGKLHAKVAIIDDNYLVTGSANYTYSAFYKNYEYIIIHKDFSLIKKFDHFFKELYLISRPYRLSR